MNRVEDFKKCLKKSIA